MSLLFVLGILTLHFVGLNADELEPITQSSSNDYDPINSLLFKTYQSGSWLRQEALNQVTEGLTSFSNRLVQEVAKMSSNNLVVSPLGVSLTLSMASYGAAESSKTVFDRVLEIPSLEYLGKIGFQALIDDLANCTGVEMQIANGVFIPSTIQPHFEFVEATTRAFRSPVQKVDFEKPIETSNTINSWCESRTQSHIKNIINPNDINVNESIVLVNAVYFKGSWFKKFDINDTRERTFYVNDVTEKLVPTMSLLGTFRHGEYPEVNATFVELPFKRGDDAHNMSMFIILPKNRNGLSIIEENFGNITIQELIKRGKDEKVYIQLPKLRIESEIDLKHPLIRFPQERMDYLFDSRFADFSRIVDYPYIFLSKFVQKAIIEIDEEGSEAVATDGVYGSRSEEDEPIRFIANCPFYAIIATTDKNPLNILTARYTG